MGGWVGVEIRVQAGVNNALNNPPRPHFNGLQRKAGEGPREGVRCEPALKQQCVFQMSRSVAVKPCGMI